MVQNLHIHTRWGTYHVEGLIKFKRPKLGILSIRDLIESNKSIGDLVGKIITVYL